MSLLRFVLVLATTSTFVCANHHHGFSHSVGTSAAGASSTSAALTSATDVAAASSTSAANDAASSTTTSAFSQGSGNGAISDPNAASSSTSASGSAQTGNNNAQGSSSLTLDPNLVQTGSDSSGNANAEAGQSPSLTDPENFINFCGGTGQQLTNGTQITDGSCNGIPMGQIPSKANMISSLITNPQSGDTIAANTPFTVDVQVTNLEAGSFTNPNTTYYAAPQTLKGGKIVGHTHVTIQSIGSLNTNSPPDATTFAFFKGVNDAGNGNGGLSANVTAGLDPGVYRVCTMTSASNHQPVLMPVAQRGAQDDCIRFTVANNGGNKNTVASGSGNDTTSAKVVVTGSGTQMNGRRVRRSMRWEAY